jgi:formylglycine-generating enzyme required for sulfatase activity
MSPVFSLISLCNEDVISRGKRMLTCQTLRRTLAAAIWLIVLPVHGATRSDMVSIPGGWFDMGTTSGFAFEGPVHRVYVAPFRMDKHEVTVAEFNVFVSQTGYVTMAEQAGRSYVFAPKSEKWNEVRGVNWRSPDSPGKWANPMEPVTQVSWNDAVAFAKWAGKRLPTEAEWEFAARGGNKNLIFPWGNEFKPGGKPVANWWQGTFPTRNTLEDGYLMRAPVMQFPANGYGLYDTSGNVWEWCADYFSKNYYSISQKENPTGPRSGTMHVVRGGSFLCSENYCVGFRVAARNEAMAERATNHVGFRCAASVNQRAEAIAAGDRRN